MKKHYFDASPTALPKLVKTQAVQDIDKLEGQSVRVLVFPHTVPKCTQMVKQRTTDFRQHVGLLKERR